MDYLAFGNTLIAAHPGSRTMPGDAGGRRVWIKQTTPPKARIWHSVQKILAAVLAMPVLRCTVSPGGAHSLRMEANRLRDFLAKGYHVPQVLAESDVMLVLSDAGPQLRDFLDRAAVDERDLALLAATRNLARLHAQGDVHGRPYLRDMTWDGQVIGFLDLEEDPLRVMPLPVAQARDVWVFLSSAARYARVPGPGFVYDDALIDRLYAEYARHAGPAVIDELRKLVKFLRPLRRLLESQFLWPKIGNDARQSGVATRALDRLLFL